TIYCAYYVFLLLECASVLIVELFVHFTKCTTLLHCFLIRRPLDYITFFCYVYVLCFFFFFFFQAEDGIRDATVTGVQTCALPISSSVSKLALVALRLARRGVVPELVPDLELLAGRGADHDAPPLAVAPAVRGEIGRASCRERV